MSVPEDPLPRLPARLESDLRFAFPDVRMESRAGAFADDDFWTDQVQVSIDSDGWWVHVDPDIDSGEDGDEEAQLFRVLEQLTSAAFPMPLCPLHQGAAHRLMPKLTRALGAAWACAEQNRALVSVGRLADLGPAVRP